MTATLFWSLGLLPFKDDFWSESVEPGNTWKSTEADPELQTLVSSLMAGQVAPSPPPPYLRYLPTLKFQRTTTDGLIPDRPVGPADAINETNVTRVLQTCRKDGVLLKPMAPAMNLDSTYTNALSHQ